MTDSLTLEVSDLVVDVLTGIYSEETGKPQPLRISLAVRMKVPDRFEPDTPLDASKNYMDLKFAASEALPEGVHFKLIEAVADHICETLFLQDDRVEQVTVKIVKLAIAEHDEKIGMTLVRDRR
ncbi:MULTISPECIES: dihydroneopterin aldolase [Croceicoccus]|uniref:dihydroneopterin aldolase n=1 Tax=Croceicoccus TaxID=1295327 RepID=UPI001920ABEE|nr:MULTISPECIES: dihydroneopterin aldolase [Croceicoccus]QQN74538.1 dihydroneopterin aldolase [Croceicoccus sp. YJ47]